MRAGYFHYPRTTLLGLYPRQANSSKKPLRSYFVMGMNGGSIKMVSLLGQFWSKWIAIFWSWNSNDISIWPRLVSFFRSLKELVKQRTKRGQESETERRVLLEGTKKSNVLWRKNCCSGAKMYIILSSLPQDHWHSIQICRWWSILHHHVLTLLVYYYYCRLESHSCDMAAKIRLLR